MDAFSAAMPQIFRHSTNYLARATIYGAIFILFAALWVAAEITRSGWNTGQWIERQQPIQSQASRRRRWHRLSLLPYFSGNVGVSRHALDGCMHELSQADLG